jgi:hypothetical protein
VLEERLQEESAREGLPAEEYARRLLEEQLLPGGEKPFWATATTDEWLRAFDEWVGSHAGSTAPPLLDGAISRAEIYGEREDRQL